MNQQLLETIVAAVKKVDASLTAVAVALQDADRRDPRLVATLRQKYAVPQKLTTVAEDFGDLARTLSSVFAQLD